MHRTCPHGIDALSNVTIGAYGTLEGVAIQCLTDLPMTFELYTIHHKRDAQLPTFKRQFIPMQVGCATSDLDLGIRRDDQHGTLSARNANFCELTGFDEVARSSTADYVGFMHYRRMFTAPRPDPLMLRQTHIALRRLSRWLRGKPQRTFRHKRVAIPDLTVLNREAATLNRHLTRIEGRYDILTPYPFIYQDMSQRDEYAGGQNPAYFDMFMDRLGKLHPELAPFINTTARPHTCYYGNIFIMRRDLFLRYWDILLSTLLDIAPDVPVEQMTFQEGRVFGYLAERFLANFIDYVSATQNIRHRMLNVVKCDFDA